MTRFITGVTTMAAFFTCVVLVAGCASTGPHDRETKIRWRSLEEGRAEAAQTRKPLMVDFFFGSGCRRCAQLEADVYSDPLVSDRIESNLVPVRVDLTGSLSPDEQKVAEQFKSGGECMLLFLDPDGGVIEDRQGVNLCFMGMVDKRKFLSYLDDVIAAMRDN